MNCKPCRTSATISGSHQVRSTALDGHQHAVVCTRGPIWLDDPCEDTRAEALRSVRRSLPFGRLRGLFVTPESDEADVSVLRAGGLAQVITLENNNTTIMEVIAAAGGIPRPMLAVCHTGRYLKQQICPLDQ